MRDTHSAYSQHSPECASWARSPAPAIAHRPSPRAPPHRPESRHDAVRSSRAAGAAGSRTRACPGIAESSPPSMMPKLFAGLTIAGLACKVVALDHLDVVPIRERRLPRTHHRRRPITSNTCIGAFSRRRHASMAHRPQTSAATVGRNRRPQSHFSDLHRAPLPEFGSSPCPSCAVLAAPPVGRGFGALRSGECLFRTPSLR